MKPREKHVWTWPIAGYLFLGGLGAGVSIVIAAADLFFGYGKVVAFGLLVAIAALGVGSFLLVFELGRPLRFWRVFSKQKAVLTFGAWMIVFLVVIDVAYLSCHIAWFPWQGVDALRLVLAAASLLAGCGVLLYTGIELSSMKGRVLWNTPLLPLLFSLSGALSGIVACALFVEFLPFASDAQASASVYAALRVLGIGFAVMTLIAVLTYAFIIYTSTNKAARLAMRRWLSGSYAPAFWGGLVFAGLVAPLVLFAFDTAVADVFAFFLVIVGCAFLRFLVVYSDDRPLLPGEHSYWAHLPKGSESFIECNGE